MSIAERCALWCAYALSVVSPIVVMATFDHRLDAIDQLNTAQTTWICAHDSVSTWYEGEILDLWQCNRSLLLRDDGTAREADELVPMVWTVPVPDSIGGGE
jgi:hypothetical protein